MVSFPYICQNTKPVTTVPLTLWKLVVLGCDSANSWLLIPATVGIRRRFCAQVTSHGLDVGFFKSLELLGVGGVFAVWIVFRQMHSLAVLAVKTAESWKALVLSSK